MRTEIGTLIVCLAIFIMLAGVCIQADRIVKIKTEIFQLKQIMLILAECHEFKTNELIEEEEK